MANLTIVVDDQLLQAARIRAVREGTSVNEVCREAIARFARTEHESRDRAAKLVEIAGRARRGAPSGPNGRSSLYDEVLRDRGLLAPDAGPGRGAR